MKILFYGAGVLGSLYAARLQEAGQEVSILARGQRLADIREHGIVLEDGDTGQRTTTRVNVVEQLTPDDAYDLVLVIMRKNHALEILPVLSANKHTPNVLFLMNNAAGPDQLVDALGADRVLIGFPMSAGYFEGHVVHTLAGTEDGEIAVLFGEVDGSVTERTREVAGTLETAAGYTAEIRTDMDAWLKCHVALLMPSLAPAMRDDASEQRVALGPAREAKTLLGDGRLCLRVPLGGGDPERSQVLREPLALGEEHGGRSDVHRQSAPSQQVLLDQVVGPDFVLYPRIGSTPAGEDCGRRDPDR